ncbi:MAG: YraN family protein [Sphingobacteriales bacterium]
MARHNTTGQNGEKLALQYFAGNGYIILYTNWRHSHYEIDIIAQKNDKLHFIEVKTRSNKKFGNPEESVGRKKMQNLMKAGVEFLYQNPGWKKVQYDVLSINFNENQATEYFLIEDVYLYD